MNCCLKSNNTSKLWAGLLFIPAMIALLAGCDMIPWSKTDDDVLARVHNRYLFSSEIKPLISPYTQPQDSVTIVSNYINNWVRQQLLLQAAEKALSDNDKDFSKQLEDYRNSLVIYEYEAQVIRQKLDTVVSMVEIQDYYDKNRANFELKENIVKVNYVQVENDPKELVRLRRLWRNEDLSSRTALENYCIQNGLNFSLFDDSWVYFNDLLKEIPIKTYNQENFLKFNRSIEVSDSLYVYFVEFKDFKIKESVAPLSMTENSIRKIIVNRRKLELLQKLRNDIFETALKNNHFEIY